MPLEKITTDIQKLTIEEVVNKLNDIIQGFNELYDRYLEISTAMNKLGVNPNEVHNLQQ
jgi:hypothetical protein